MQLTTEKKRKMLIAVTIALVGSIFVSGFSAGTFLVWLAIGSAIALILGKLKDAEPDGDDAFEPETGPEAERNEGGSVNDAASGTDIGGGGGGDAGP